MMLLKLTGNKIMHHNLMLRPCEKNMLFIEYQLKKRLDFRSTEETPGLPPATNDA